MISRLLPALKRYLSEACAALELPTPEPGLEVRAPRVFIGDFPPKRENGQDAREFPCVLLTTVAGYSADGLEFADIAALLGVYCPEQGDAEGLEMSLVLLQNAVARALRRCLDAPLEQRFALVRDEKNRLLWWQRVGDPNKPRPFAQVTLVSRWMSPGWE